MVLLNLLSSQKSERHWRKGSRRSREGGNPASFGASHWIPARRDPCGHSRGRRIFWLHREKCRLYSRLLRTLHALKGELKGHWAVSVGGNWRLTFALDGTDAILVNYQDYH